VQLSDLLRIKVAPVADRNLLVDDRSDAHAAEPRDGMADRLEHPPYLALPPLVQHDFHERLFGA
jgi:hypothetical protein